MTHNPGIVSRPISDREKIENFQIKEVLLDIFIK